MWINAKTLLPQSDRAPIQYAIKALARDIKKKCSKKTSKWTSSIHNEEETFSRITLTNDPSIFQECFVLLEKDDCLYIAASDDLGFIYGMFEISRRFLGILPFWFWNDQVIESVEQVRVPTGFIFRSPRFRVRFRGWMVNDETLLTHWKVNGSSSEPFVMVYEALLRCGGNMVIPGTGKTGEKYEMLASSMGLIITQHHAEPLGARMFVRSYPELQPKFSKHPDLFRKLWQESIDRHNGMKMIWNLGFRGQGDYPFWENDPLYDTDEKRGKLLSSILLEQYLMVKNSNRNAVCCTNLYGEVMDLYQKGVLELPEDIILIRGDNGYGKMVSRRQGNNNPRINSLPSKLDRGKSNGIYYHVSFYDLQAASHITMLPNKTGFVEAELKAALSSGSDKYWIINCSNVKPHVYLLDYIAKLWRNGQENTNSHLKNYTGAYYGIKNAEVVGNDLNAYAEAAIQYGPYEDDHAGDQFYNHVPRMLMTQFMKDRDRRSEDLDWLCGTNPAIDLKSQNTICIELFTKAENNYQNYLELCRKTWLQLKDATRILYENTLLLQAKLYWHWSRGAVKTCKAIEAGFENNWKVCFFQAGLAKQEYLDSYASLQAAEHGKWIGFYANECQTDVRQTAQVLSYLMSYARVMGEGPHFYRWMREYMDGPEDREEMLILNTERHPDDDELLRYMSASEDAYLDVQ